MNLKSKMTIGVVLLILILGVLFAIPTGFTSLVSSAAVAIIIVVVLVKRVVF